MHKECYTVEMLCRVLEVSRSGYYSWKRQPVGKRQQRREALSKRIKEAFELSKERYGSPRISKELEQQGQYVSCKTVAKYMKNMGLKSKLSRRFKPATKLGLREMVADNLLNRDFTSCSPAEKCVSDITYLPTKDGFLYLTAILDLFERDVIGWNLSDGMSVQETILPALKRAASNRPFRNGMILHSDRGVQYTCRATKNVLEAHHIIPSMSRKGNCWDNAVAESFFKSLKSELLDKGKYLTKEQMKIAVFEYIEIWYRKKRRHSYLNYLTIPEFWKIYNTKYKSVKYVA